jgi:hypothetical protein
MDITDALDSYLKAKIRVGQWEQEFNQRFYKPMIEAAMGMTLEAVKNSPNIDRQRLESNLSPEAQMRLRGNDA